MLMLMLVLMQREVPCCVLYVTASMCGRVCGEPGEVPVPTFL